MRIHPLPYRPTGAWWQRLWQALVTAVTNIRLRRLEIAQHDGEDDFEYWQRQLG